MIANHKGGLLSAKVYAVNPAHDHIGDQPCYASIDALPEAPELLIIAVPESLTVRLVRAAANAGVKAAVIVTSGYAESGKKEVENEIGRIAARHGMRILGPNTIGLIDTWSGVDSLFLRPTKTLPDGSEISSLQKPLKGGVVIITQSGHLGEIISEELAANRVGIRALVGTGNQLDVSIEDVIQYFANDPHTTVMAVYLEGLRAGSRFLEVASNATKRKPLVVFKVGKTQVGARAALTHTASLVGDYDVYQAAFRRCGVIEADSVQELVDYSISLSMLPDVAGKRVAIVTNAGGVGAISADEAQKAGLQVEPLTPEAQRRLRSVFKDENIASSAALGNPIDLTASASTDDFVRVTKEILSSRRYDLGLLLPTHQTPAIDASIAGKLSEAILETGKPVAVCVIGNSELASRIHLEFISNGIPSFPTPERAVRALAAATSVMEYKGESLARLAARRKAPGRLHLDRGRLPVLEISRLLQAYGIAEPKSVVVRTAGDVGKVRRLTFPVACKMQSAQLHHKKDIGGVVLGVQTPNEVQSVLSRFKKLADTKWMRFDGMLVQEMVADGTELILGGTRDPTFGPVVALGMGGTYTEIIRDFSLAVAPVSPAEVRRMLSRTKLDEILGGYRGGPKVDENRLCRLVSDFSRIMVENPSIEQMEVNPLIATSHDILAVDTRVIIAKANRQLRTKS
jgi:acyl-CoA synthetase (NDP forming)